LNHKIEVNNIAKTIKKTKILHDISLNIKSGETVGLLGPNGAGKTTSFYTICGLIQPTSGTILLDGYDITHLPLHKRALRGIGYLPQESSIFRDLTVEENLMLAAEVAIDDKKQRLEKYK
jgi:lipopolysaccharide export system ATP-binding protein